MIIKTQVFKWKFHWNGDFAEITNSTFKGEMWNLNKQTMVKIKGKASIFFFFFISCWGQLGVFGFAVCWVPWVETGSILVTGEEQCVPANNLKMSSNFQGGKETYRWLNLKSSLYRSRKWGSEGLKGLSWGPSDLPAATCSYQTNSGAKGVKRL